jgi:hypothetical protein
VSITGTLQLDEMVVPSENVNVDRLIYGSIAPFQEALQLVTNAKFSASNYSRLESYLRKEGQLQDAKKVGEAWAARQRCEERSFSFLWSWFLWLFVDNGFEPERALYIGAIVVVLGIVIFWGKENTATTGGQGATTPSPVPAPAPQAPPSAPTGGQGATTPRARWKSLTASMQKCDPSKPTPNYNPFLYSLDLFVPAISLGMAKYWMPENSDKLRWAWLYIQRILGWIIVPIGLLALAGMVKPPGG